MTLENLVPPLELCKQIPAGAFEDSALVWWGMCVYPRRHPDGARYDEPYRRPGSFPAPTLAEILDKLDYYTPIQRDSSNLYYPSYPKYDDDDFLDPNPATAALKLWLELEGGK